MTVENLIVEIYEGLGEPSDLLCRMAEPDHRNQLDVRRDVLLDKFVECPMGFFFTPEMMPFLAVDDVEEVECRRIQQPERGSILHGRKGELRQVGRDEDLAKIDHTALHRYTESVYQVACQDRR